MTTAAPWDHGTTMRTPAASVHAVPLLLWLSWAGCENQPAPAHDGAAKTRAEWPTPDPGPQTEPWPEATTAAITEAWSARPLDYAPRTRHLGEDGRPRFVNRLLLETSPYLQQHAHNPVDWYPWGDEAFEVAKRLGRPVFLSVGYSTCHWCHVMEEESFEDLEIAGYLNANFVSVKVDREELPAVDAVYMAAVNAINGRGGWPMSVWLTTDRVPYFAGTYYPARDGDRAGKPGFYTVLQRMKAAYDEQPDKVVSVAAEVAASIELSLAPDMSGEMPDTDVLGAAAARYADDYDHEWGGRRGAPKFPSSMPVRFLIQEHQRTGDAALLEMALHTLRMMAAGGMHDHLGGGFHRYSTDVAWLVPHFEKMLYDNALLAMAYTQAWSRTGDPQLAAVAEATLRHLDRDMGAPHGGFYSATDADSRVPGTSEREEGWFFTWTPDELQSELDEAHAVAAIAWYAVEPGGNFEGRSVLHTPRSAPEVALELGIETTELQQRIAAARISLLEARATRPLPARDNKVLTAWNGLAISAFAQAALILDRPEHAERAARAADFVLGSMRSGGRLSRTWTAGTARHAAVIEDYAFLVAGLLDLFEATGTPRWLAEAIALDQVVAKHYELPSGGWYRAADDAEPLLARERPDHDGAEPTGASVHTRSLYRLAALTSDERYSRRADAALAAHSRSLERGAMPELLLALDWRVDRAKEVVIVTPEDRAEGNALLDVYRAHRPRNSVLVLAPQSALEELGQLAPLVRQKLALGGVPTAYVCEQGICDQPTPDPELFAAQLRRAPRLGPKR